MNDSPNTDHHSPEPPSDANLALRVHMMPSDVNVQGSVFGGAILSLIDQAGFYEARLHGLHRWVTVAMDGVEFRQPVFSGDVVSLYSKTTRKGRTSITINVHVHAERYESNEVVSVTVANLTMVSVDSQSNPIPFTSPPSIDRPDPVA
jgi:acyl-CoA thioesterase YciA